MSIVASKETKTNMKAKGLTIVNNNVVDDTGEIVDLVGLLSKIYEDSPFDFSCTRADKEELDVEIESEDEE